MRKQSQYLARRVIADDKAAYNLCWDNVVKTDSQMKIKAIERLQQLTKSMTPVLQHPLRQRTISGSGSLNAEEKCCVPVQDLDQLFAMAGGLHPYLRCKVQKWAAISGGCFPVLLGKDPIFCSWNHILSDGALYNRVKWARPKSRRRAIEKVFRSYDRNVSRLLDCCRQVISSDWTSL